MERTEIEGGPLTEASLAGGKGKPPADLAVRNESRIGAMLWIGFYTILLNILTLTVFRFWGRTHFRRRLWSDTRVGGEMLEYTGRGMELFIGFVIAIFTLMAPTIGALFAAQLFLPPALFIAVLIPIYLFLFIIVGVAIFLARRYHLSRTRLRGIRFAQTGSAWGYGWANFGYTLLAVVTLGWFGPAAQIRLSRRLWSNAWYGGLRFKFEDTPEAKREPVYLSFAVAWIGGVLAYGGWAAFLFASGIMSDMDAVQPDFEVLGMIYFSMIPLIIVVALASAWHFAVITRRITKSLRVADVKFSSRLGAFDIIELAITNTLLVVFTLGFGAMAAQMRMWKRLANRLALSGSIDFAAVEQSTVDAPKQGEGLADGLDLVSNF
jgi:uncharacterized membrane protein YjgN (DUF898 family)